jgi:sulfur-oxidizing protein SoxZ|tara:strand:+ start:115 stop:495 length:381 start_codon:yes stop_codon:yes gene_type:complete
MFLKMEKLRRLKYKKIVKVGENVKIKTLAEHEMETGVRRDNITGIIYPRLIIQSVIAKYNGKIVFKANWFSGVSANPYLAFYITAKESGLIEIEWKDDHATTSYKRGYLKVINEKGNEVLPVKYDL